MSQFDPQSLEEKRALSALRLEHATLLSGERTGTGRGNLDAFGLDAGSLGLERDGAGAASPDELSAFSVLL